MAVAEPRSRCPINRGVELLGDAWSLVILRDVAFCDRRSFRELLTRSGEGISPPMLSRRLQHLVSIGLLTKEAVPRGKIGRYSLTEAGIQLVPLLFELARVGHMLDPTTESTEPRFAAWQGGPDEIGDYQDELRALHLTEGS